MIEELDAKLRPSNVKLNLFLTLCFHTTDVHGNPI